MAALPLPTPAGNWRDHAACSGQPTELWYPESGDNGTHAKTICRTCPVTTECINEALQLNDDHGIRGALNPEERRRLKPTHIPCRRCGTTIQRLSRTARRLYCDTCRDIRRAETDARNGARYRGTPIPEQAAAPTSRARLESRADGNTGTAITSHGHVPLPGEGT